MKFNKVGEIQLLLWFPFGSLLFGGLSLRSGLQDGGHVFRLGRVVDHPFSRIDVSLVAGGYEGVDHGSAICVVVIVAVAVSPCVLQCWGRKEGRLRSHLLPFISSQNYNENIKTVFEKVGIDSKLPLIRNLLQICNKFRMGSRGGISVKLPEKSVLFDWKRMKIISRWVILLIIIGFFIWLTFDYAVLEIVFITLKKY